jgi:hypothetical protein
MIEFEKPYFRKPYYFRLEDGKDKISLYYSVSETISEAKGKDNKIDFDKTSESELKKLIKKILDSGKKLNPKDVYNSLFKLKNKSKNNKTKKEGGEIEELVDDDGTFSTSNIPILDMGQHTSWTQDMRAALIRQAGSTFPFKARIYYGESEEEQEIIDEEDFSDAYGYEEIEGEDVKTFKGCISVFKDLEIEDPFERYERCMSFGFDPELDKNHQQRIVELKKEKMKNILDELLLNKKSDEKEISKKNIDDDTDEESVIYKLLLRNIESIKKIAEKENIDISKLIKKLK